MKHLDEANESYFKHMIEAWLIVLALVGAASVCFVHSIIPAFFKRTASNTMRAVLNRTDSRYGRKI